MQRGLIFLLFVASISGLYATPKNLVREDMYLRPGFDKTWIKEWPERSKALAAWHHQPSSTTDTRPVKIATLGEPFPKPGIYRWPSDKVHEYTAVTRFFLQPDERKAPVSWGLRLGSIADNWQVFLNGTEIGSAWHIDPAGERILVHRAIRDTVIELPSSLLASGENILAFRLAGDHGSAEVGFYLGQPYEVDHLRTLLSRRSETVVLILICLYLAIGLYHLLLYSRRRQESYNFYFGIFCVGLFVYLFTRTAIVFEIFEDTTLIQKVEYIVLFNVLTPFLIFIDRLFEKRITLFPKIYGAFGAALSLAVIPTTSHFNTTILRVWQVSALLGILYFLAFQLFRFVIREIRTRYADSQKVTTIAKSLSAFKNTMLFSPAGNLLIGILTIMGTAVFDILDSVIFATGIAFTKYGFALFVIGIAVMLANRFLTVHNQVEELNENLEKKVEERTRELKESLVRVQDLKKQQDADYFLTAQLLKPLAANTAHSDNIDIEYLIRQKKTFEFRKWKSEIGGDINMAASIMLKDKPFVVFVNADAMGKSMQGAGGALVLGAVFQSTIERLRWTKELSDVFPEIWLHTTFLELHRIFESFEGSMLISLVIGLIDEKSGLMYYINAEHPSMVLYRNGETRFLDTEILRKLGTPGIKGTLEIHCFQLEPGDILVMGSDGRDDVILGHNADGSNIINENEQLFLEHVREAKGNLQEIHHRVASMGEIMDDLSLLRIEFNPKEIPAAVEEQDEKLEALRQHANELAEKTQYNEAAELLMQIYEMRPQDIEICYLIAQNLRREKKIKAALQWAERAVLRDGHNLQYLLLAAELNIMVRRANKAQGYLRRVLELEPEHQRAAKLETMILQ
ncbi:SpoIIE family protein phosphatase [Turneriella parva]|uniref:Stage II sporulation protein E n=1 Tax=Turneriella parva (strain ATCC BAA-1111 / DSM 21527 / NCTC 11395 / H) TaxID=869212 RepID=I4B606_TURPD|nr:SpoIIE family protein phosphatase [Turneriella parva]AFM12713.1 Stage II sporulation protein E [Turneriella parva DSM 21527]